MGKKYKLDNIDKKILSILANNSKNTNIELSKEIGISPSPCLRRVKILEDNKVIKSYSIDIDFSFLEYSLLFFASINTNCNNEEEQAIFQKELLNIPEVLEVYLLSNNTDYLIKIIVKNYLDYKLLISKKLSRIPFVKKVRTTKISNTLKKANFINL